MIVAAALNWWNERPEDLAACVRGIANVADRVVALDGAYRRYPGATARSDPEQGRAIEETAKECGLDSLILSPNRPWAGEVEKRTILMTLATQESDWVVVVDADHIISTNREKIREELETTYHDCFNVTFYTPVNPDVPKDKSVATNWHASESYQVKNYPLVMRSFPGMRLEKRHWHYSAIVNGSRHWIGGQWTNEYGCVPPFDFTSHQFNVEHRCLYRTPEQVIAARAWYNDRVMVVARTEQENDVPGLPPPDYDYTTLPF